MSALIKVAAAKIGESPPARCLDRGKIVRIESRVGRDHGVEPPPLDSSAEIPSQTRSIQEP